MGIAVVCNIQHENSYLLLQNYYDNTVVVVKLMSITSELTLPLFKPCIPAITLCIYM